MKEQQQKIGEQLGLSENLMVTPAARPPAPEGPQDWLCEMPSCQHRCCACGHAECGHAHECVQPNCSECDCDGFRAAPEGPELAAHVRELLISRLYKRAFDGCEGEGEFDGPCYEEYPNEPAQWCDPCAMEVAGDELKAAAALRSPTPREK